MPDAITSLSQLLAPSARALLVASGSELVQQIGFDVVRGVVLDVLTGKNLRDSTEILTRRRLAALNLALVALFLEGSNRSADFVTQLPHLATQILGQKRLSKSEKWLAQWVLGLTDKSFQNVLRDDREALIDYRDQYIQVCQQVIADFNRDVGELSGTMMLNSTVKAEIDWLFMTYLLNTIGAQTLTIRGSEKSAYGKLFEKLVLGALLHVLGFHYTVYPPEKLDHVFWLSSREERRESDATLLYQAGKAVRFDIGFIGRGNPEISLDKVTRFEREITLNRSRYYVATVILVDRIGANSRIERLAEAVDGNIIQMSASYWPQQVARLLNRKIGFVHPLVKMDQSEIHGYLEKAIETVPLAQFMGLNTH